MPASHDTPAHTGRRAASTAGDDLADRSGPAPRTTIVIATRNRAEELLRTLREQRTAFPRTPVVVVDNGSDADLRLLVEPEFPDVEVVRSPRNLGAVARNLGVLRARTPYIAFSDDDSWWEPGALAEAERVLDDHPAVALVAGRTLVGADGAPDPVTDLMRDSALPRTHPMPGPPVLGFTACAAVVRRRAFAEAGGFSRLLFFVAEEKLLSYDLAAKGWDLCYVSSVVAHHHPSPHRPPSDWRRTLELRNNALIAWMRRPVRVALGEARELAAAARHDRVARRALLAAVRRLPSALLRRRRLPARVEDMIRLLEG